MERKIFGYNEYDSYVFGVNSFGKNCGFGTPVVATRVSSYADWIEENVLGVSVKKNPSANKPIDDQIVFIDHEHETEGNACTIPGETKQGVCTEPAQCSGFSEHYRARRQQVKFCGFHPSITVCCPGSLSSRVGTTKNDLRQCSKAFKELRQSATGASGILRYENNKVFTHTAAIGFAIGNGIDYRCWGALITEEFVVTTASCLNRAR